MRRYYFHIYDGDEILDEDGTVLTNHDDARAHAITVTGELLKDAGLKRWRGCEWQLKVADSMGAIVCTLRFSVEDGSVT